jgi:hypothetical protein
MTIPTLTFTLTYGGTTLTMASVSGEQESVDNRSQTIGRSASGVIYVYDRTTTWCGVDYKLRLTAAQRTALLSFFDNTVKGGLRTFTLTDHLLGTYTGCRFREPLLKFTKTAGGGYHVTLSIETTPNIPG